MSMKRKWLRILMLLIMGGASFVGAKMNAKEIEDVLHIMNETKVEFTIPDQDHKGDGIFPKMGIDSVQSTGPSNPILEDN